MITSNSKRRRGMVATLVCLVLVTLLGLTALAVDGGLMQDNKRRVQAALAAATKLYQNYNSITTSNPDPGGGAVSAAMTSAGNNGFPNNGKVIAVTDDGSSPSDGTGSIVTVNIPPKSGPFTGMLDY